MGILQLDLSATATSPDPEVLAAQAQLLRSAGRDFKDAVSAAAGKWTALEGLYDTPHKYLVLGAMNTPSRQAGVLAENTAAAAGALEDFAEAVQAMRRDRAALQREISAANAALRQLLADDTDGHAFQDKLLNYQWEFQDRVNALTGSYEEAREICTAAVSGIARASADVPSHYHGGALDLQSHDAERLHRQATAPGASAEDVRSYYDFLAGMDASRYAEFAADYPEAAVYPPRLGLAAEQQAEFWHSLTQGQQESLVKHLPALAGNTEGVPYAVRAAANAAVLAMVLKPSWRATDEQRESYKSIQNSIKKKDNKDPTGLSLIAFDPAEPPLAAVAVGNMDTAASVSINVSGMGSSTRDMDDAVWAANNLHEAQKAFTSDHAVVAWIGYDSPDMPPSTQVLLSDKARIGGDKLATVIDGVYNTRAGDVPRVSITAHSYGTTTAAFALSQTVHTVDTVVFFGSAGIDPEAARTAADLNAREVYATQGKADVVAPGGILGSHFGDPRLSPTAESWGSRVFSSEEQHLGGEERSGNGGHSLEGTEDGAGLTETERGRGYLDYGTASLWSIAAASAGDGDLLTLSDQSLTDEQIENAKARAADIYYGPGRAVDAAQLAGAAAVDRIQGVNDAAGDALQGAAALGADLLQEHYLPDVGPYEHPLDPLVDGIQRHVGAGFDRGQQSFNDLVDEAQTMFDSAIDTNQKAADDYFKRQWLVLEFTAGTLVRYFGSH